MPDSNHRIHQRVGVRTQVTIVTLGAEDPVTRGWTDDLSPAGARIVCEQELSNGDLILRVMLPGLKEQFFKARTVRGESSVLTSFRGQDKTLYTYGVQFTGLCTADEQRNLEDLLAPV